MSDLNPLNAQAIERLTVNSDPYLSCDDCFDHIDVVVDSLLDSGAPLPEDFRVHLLACAVCREEAESLAQVVAPDHDLPPEAALNQLDNAIAEPPRS